MDSETKRNWDLIHMILRPPHWEMRRVAAKSNGKPRKPTKTEFIVGLFLPDGMKPKAAAEFLRQAITNHLMELAEENAPAESIPETTFTVKAAPVAKPALAK